MSPKKRPRCTTTNTKTNKLFSTLHSLEQTDVRASKKRKQTLQNSVKQSRAANDESRINSILLELRILIQRSTSAANAGVNTNTKNGEKVAEELDGLLENLLVARRELMNHHLGEGDVDYLKLIQSNAKSSDYGQQSDSTDNDNVNNSISSTLQNEYASLQSHWQITLNKHHSNLALQAGLSTATSKFASKAVDVSFWEQVQSSVEHDQFRKVRPTDTSGFSFDDSKLYQQMLKDFISSGGAERTGKKGMDPAQDAAERLKRAMRKKSGGDIDLNVLFDPEGEGKAVSGKKNTVDRKASKGRKIRYVAHPKMVNFMFPVARKEPMISDDVWFKSLFGGVGRR